MVAGSVRCCFPGPLRRARAPGIPLPEASSEGTKTCPADVLQPGSAEDLQLPTSSRSQCRARTLPGDDEECARRLQGEFDREAAEKSARARFQCKLCLETCRYDDSVELDCLHRFCKDCFFRHLEVKIREKRLKEHELCCPMPGCDCQITVPQVEGATRETPLWDRFLSGRAELWRPDEGEAEILVVCPTPDCCRFVAAANVKEVRCPKCSGRFCPQCLHKHPGQTCMEHAAWRKENDVREREFEELMKQKRWQRCPCCKASVERSVGCNFMTCHSEVCRGKKHFCYLCGVELTKGEHFSHFPHGLFTNACANVDRRDEAELPQADWRRVGADGNWLTGLVEDFRDWAAGAAGGVPRRDALAGGGAGGGA